MKINILLKVFLGSLSIAQNRYMVCIGRTTRYSYKAYLELYETK